MRTILSALLAVTLLFSCGESSTEDATSTSGGTASAPEPGSPEDVACRLAEAVIDSNYQAIVDMIITNQEMVDVIQGSNVTTMGKEVAVKNVPTEIGKMKMDFANGLKQIRDDGRTSGIEWSNCKYKRATYEIEDPNGYDMMQLKVVLECNGMEQTFTVTDVVDTENGWKLGGTMMFGDIQQQ